MGFLDLLRQEQHKQDLENQKQSLKKKTAIPEDVVQSIAIAYHQHCKKLLMQAVKARHFNSDNKYEIEYRFGNQRYGAYDPYGLVLPSNAFTRSSYDDNDGCNYIYWSDLDYAKQVINHLCKLLENDGIQTQSKTMNKTGGMNPQSCEPYILLKAFIRCNSKGDI